MSIERLLSTAFPSSSRLRGEEYFSDGLVEVVAASDLLARFSVNGTEELAYATSLAHRPEIKQVALDCSCPHYESGNLCKHLWACVLTADKQGLLQQLAVSNGISLVYGPPDDEMLDVEEEAAEPEDYFQEAFWKMAVDRAQARVKLHERGRTTSTRRSQPAKIAHFAVDLEQSARTGRIYIQFLVQEQLKSGTLGPIKATEMNHDGIPEFADPADQELLLSLLGKTEVSASDYGPTAGQGRRVGGVNLSNKFAGELLVRLAGSGRLHLLKAATHRYSRSARLELIPYPLSEGVWRLELELGKAGRDFALTGQVTNGTEIRKPIDVLAQLGGFVFFRDKFAQVAAKFSLLWLTLLRERKALEIPGADLDKFLRYFYTPGQTTSLLLPAEVQFTEISDLAPKGRLTVSLGAKATRSKTSIEIAYGAHAIPLDYEPPSIVVLDQRQRIWRNPEIEGQIRAAAGGLDQRDLTRLMEQALALGWEVFAQDQSIRLASDFSLGVSSGVDWFELNGELKFDQQSVALPELLKLLEDSTRLIQLSDGSMGVIPDAWLQKLRLYSNMGKATESGIRLNRIQALFLSASLEENFNLTPDRKFSTLHKVVADVQGIKPVKPAHLNGNLRPYQEHGLGWLTVLTQNQIGGILADDMGLGKTIQILALLAERKGVGKPSLIVAPKSLVFNWRREAEKFTPQLKVLDHTGQSRAVTADSFASYDVILTTYPSLRSDVEMLRRVKFDLFVLDEAHYIKNPKSQAAMACHLIQATQTFCLTGTPVENSLTDLFSILSVANPGLISEQQTRRWAVDKDPQTLQALSRALSPFLLRRTKAQVLKDLPEKSEQVLYCELSPAEKEKYDELKTYYWTQLSGKFKDKGLARSKIEVLEALLRLRQAACHQALLDKNSTLKSSAKFELLLEQVESVIRDGHKALIFSQFTSLLKLLVPQLQERGIAFEYLDGQTKDRQERVDRFQSDESIKLFLLSLKAGGVGLNLTAADYVFVLDPWWNPAAETQAIDRTHRIGQTKKVFAYKLITKDTVEEKILELQKSKRELAVAVVSDQSSLLKNLKMADLEALFS